MKNSVLLNMSKSEQGQEGATSKIPALITQTADLSELARIGAQIVQAAAAARVRYVPIQPNLSPAVPSLVNYLSIQAVEETKEALEAKRQATLRRISGGIIEKNARKIELKALETLKRKDAYEFKIPQVTTAFNHEIVHCTTEQSLANPLELTVIPSIGILKHFSVVLQTYDKMYEGYTYVKSSFGMFDSKAVETMINLHKSGSIQKEVDEELFWFSYPHEKPFAINQYPSMQSIRKFMNVLYLEPIKTVLPDYDMTVEDLASICCNRSLSSIHIKWVVRMLNTMQKDTLCIYVDDENATKEFIQSVIQDIDERPSALVFIFMVRISNDESIPGCHFTLCHVEQCEKKIVYADSLGLAPHKTFLTELREYYSMIYADDIIGFSLNYCHDYRNNSNAVHVCQRGTACALHYPLHESIFLSALVVAEIAAIACLAKSFFQHITATDIQESTDSGLYLKDPDTCSGYLRHVLISWMAEHEINIDNLIPASFPHIDEVETEVSVDAIMLDHGEYTECQEGQAEEIAEVTSMATTETDVAIAEIDNANENGINSSQATSDFTDLDVTMESSQSQLSDLESETKDSLNQSLESIIVQSNTPVLHESVVETSSSQNETAKRLNKKCPYCEFITHRLYNLKRHISRLHKNEKKREDFESGNCICIECGFRCKRIKEFRLHLSNVHHMIFRGEVLEFNNKQDFSEWKSRLEEKDLCYFVKSSGNFVVKNGDFVRYHYCNHSGFYRPKIVDGSRPERKFGSYKMDNVCTAEMRVVEKSNGSIKVQVCYSHYGHPREFRGTWLTLDRRRWVESQLNNGTSEAIFEALKNSLIVGRRLETRLMKSVFGVDDVTKNDDDQLSLLNWIAEWDKLNVNPVLFYKLKDVASHIEQLETDDFVVVVQSDIQKKMAVEFSKNGLCCVSAKCASYFLTTLIVIDEFDDGFPVASCISNRIDEVVLKIFFRYVQHNVGELKPLWFACDCNDEFYDVFIETTNHCPRRLTYFTSIERRFRTELDNVQDIMSEVWLYEILLTAVQENNAKTFEDLLSLLLQRGTRKSTAFHSLISQHWLRRKHEWAFCYRPADIDAAVEEFRHWILQRYSKGKVNQRLDTGVFNLLSYVRRKWINRNTRLKQHRDTREAGIISELHQKSLKMILDNVKPMEDREDKYEILDGKDSFSMKLRIGGDKSCKCDLRCSQCDSCPHAQCCTCPESLLNAQMCVHAHLLSRFLSDDAGRFYSDPYETGQDVPQQDLQPMSVESSERNLKDFNSGLQPVVETANNGFLIERIEETNSNADITLLKHKLMSSMIILMQEVKTCNNYEQLKNYEKKIDTVTGIVRPSGDDKKANFGKRKIDDR